MQSANKATQTLALRIGLLELAIVLVGLIFVRKEIYLHGQFNAMFLQWQEYAILFLIFLDGACRGFAERLTNGKFLSPFRNRALRFLLPLTLFLFVACASLCDQVNWAAMHQQWWRDAGVLILASGVFLSIRELKTRPKGLEIAASDSAVFLLPKSFVSEDPDQDSVTASNNAHGSAGVPPAFAVPSSKKTDPSNNDAPGNNDAAIAAVATANPASNADIVPEGPWKSVRYPDRSAILIELVGISMALAAWLPLLTLPGLIVAFKWEIADLEAFRIRKLGQKYINYAEETWFLIPYIY